MPLIAIGLACRAAAHEPTDGELREVLARNRSTLEELHQLLRHDASTRLFIVNADDAGGSRCSDDRVGLSCLPQRRWHEYSSKQKAARVLEVRRYNTGAVYFETYRGPMVNSAQRSRGLVYDPGVPKVAYEHDDVEERVDLGDGWYAYLLIDD